MMIESIMNLLMMKLREFLFDDDKEEIVLDGEC